MILRKSPHYLVLLLFLCFTVSSCEKFTGDQTVPAYLSIDSIYLTTTYYSQGTASQSITDAWVYVDDEFLGAFELPARFPVLKSGKHTVKILPGIKKNGIAATRSSYDYYAPVQKSVNFTPDSTSRIGTLKTNYQATTQFTWKEDFDNVILTLDTTSRSTAWIERTPGGSPLTFEGIHSGLVVLDSIHNFFECETQNEFVIPYAAVFLEMNFNISNSLTVGVITYGNTVAYQTPILTLNSTNGKWKKIYIDLSNTLNAYTGMSTYRVYMGTFKDAGLTQSTVLFDNFKLITRP
ncbi:MAG: hypothetical protein WCR01_13830 [Bacteroidota bacterium]